jgi:neprilysin
MNWLHYLSKNSLANPTQNFTDKPKDANKDYFKFLKDTPKRTIANVIGWRIVQRAIPFLGEDVRKILLEYETAVHGKQDNDQRWKFCVSLTTERVAVGVGSLYIDEYFSEEDRKATIKMVDFIQDEYLSTLNSSDWIDNEVKINASKLARKMFKVIGYHEHLRSEDFIKNNFYKNLERWPKENFLELGLALAIFDADREYDRTNQDVKEEWTKYARPATVNAFYSPRDNSIRKLI